ncbi:hypothetical protein [Yinghuangia soli]|uniref:Uncharacterized protein n=1 Tax=Yinghuangia soli TaxID=2908204 RepID=A0AA41PZT8_9ACTN|nr:hypothetical protein [Yinghuangia soli]MCF2528365.1 hypothetical protein [Yinghuangia soli]
MNPHLLLFESAPEALRGHILPRLGQDARNSLLGGPGTLDAATCAFVITQGSTADRVALACNRSASPEVLFDLAGIPDPDVAAALYERWESPREVVLRVIPAVPRSVLMPELSAFQRQIRYKTENRDMLLAESGDPELIAYAMRNARSMVQPDALVLGILGMLRASGPDAVTALLADVQVPDEEYVRWFPEAIRTALADPTDEAAVERAAARIPDTASVLSALRSTGGSWTSREALFAPRAPIDWGVVVEAHREKPFSAEELEALGLELGCPDSLRRPYQESIPAKDANVRRQVIRELHESGGDFRLNALPRARLQGYWTAAAGPDRPPAAALLARAAPAYPALELFQDVLDEDAEEVRRALAALAGPRLGDDVDSWVIALSLLQDFAGTTTELFDTAAAVAVPDRTRG